MRIIGGTYKRKEIFAPKGLETRPTSSRLRETVFNICQSRVEGARFLDLFAGSGAMGLEALSRGATFVLFIDNDKESIRCIKRNLEAFDATSRGHALCHGVEKFVDSLDKREAPFDLIYIDPPYGKCDTQKLLSLIDSGNALTPGGWLFLEEAASAQIDVSAFKTLTQKSMRKVGRSCLYQFSTHA